MSKKTTKHAVMPPHGANEIAHRIAKAIGVENCRRISLEFEAGKPAVATIEAWVEDSGELREALQDVTRLCDKFRRVESARPV